MSLNVIKIPPIHSDLFRSIRRLFQKIKTNKLNKLNLSDLDSDQKNQTHLIG